ncbi:hypothetical protein ON010_g14050 [Phytophthora cinnamomi]|nr:hypothetical protein ON010_g14050 [Phytophthora cinnamomi]
MNRRLQDISGSSPDNEDRGLFTSFKVNKLAKSGKSDDFVKQKLKLDGLSDEALVASPQFKYYMKFWLKTEKERLKKWLEDGLPPYEAWANLGLERMDSAKREQSATYKAYMRYTQLFDDGVFERFKRSEVLVAMIGPYPEESNALVRFWVKEKRPWYYVKAVCDLSDSREYFTEYARLANRESRK